MDFIAYTVIKYINKDSIANLSLVSKTYSIKTLSIRNKLLIQYANSYRKTLNILTKDCQRNISIYPKNSYGIKIKNPINLVCPRCNLFVVTEISHKTEEIILDDSILICNCIKCDYCYRFKTSDYPGIIIDLTQQCYCFYCINCNKIFNKNHDITNVCICNLCENCDKYLPYELINKSLDETLICDCKRCKECNKKALYDETNATTKYKKYFKHSSDSLFKYFEDKDDICICKHCKKCDYFFCNCCDECENPRRYCSCPTCFSCNKRIYDECECERCKTCGDVKEICECCDNCLNLKCNCKCELCDKCVQFTNFIEAYYICECYDDQMCSICLKIYKECQCKRCDCKRCPSCLQYKIYCNCKKCIHCDGPCDDDDICHFKCENITKKRKIEN